MAIDPVTGMLGASAIGALGGIFGANSAADAQEDAARRAADTQRRNLLAQVMMYEPQRNVGYQALGDLSSLYGYSTPAYSTPNDIRNSMTKLGAKAVKKGLRRGMSVNELAQMGTLGSISGKALRRLTKAGLTAADIQQLQGGSTGNIGGQGQPQPAGPAGNMSRFFASPDYEFRRGEGMRGLEQSAAARGGAFSGDALKALSEYNSNLASGEFGNYWNRLSQMAGMGTAATNNLAQAGQNTANNVSSAQQAVGDARASGIMGGVNTATNAINSGVNNYLLYNYLNRPAAPAQSPYGPYRSGYRFPGG